jgi:hypothetical protein
LNRSGRPHPKLQVRAALEHRPQYRNERSTILDGPLPPTDLAVSFLAVLGGLPPGSVSADWVTRYGSGRVMRAFHLTCQKAGGSSPPSAPPKSQVKGDRGPDTTTLRAQLPDQAAPWELILPIIGLGLELVELRPLRSECDDNAAPGPAPPMARLNRGSEKALPTALGCRGPEG